MPYNHPLIPNGFTDSIMPIPTENIQKVQEVVVITPSTFWGTWCYKSHSRSNFEYLVL